MIFISSWKEMSNRSNLPQKQIFRNNKVHNHQIYMLKSLDGHAQILWYCMTMSQKIAQFCPFLPEIRQGKNQAATSPTVTRLSTVITICLSSDFWLWYSETSQSVVLLTVDEGIQKKSFPKDGIYWAQLHLTDFLGWHTGMSCEVCVLEIFSKYRDLMLSEES